MAAAAGGDAKSGTSGVPKDVLIAAFRTKLKSDPVIVVDTSGDCGMWHAFVWLPL